MNVLPISMRHNPAFKFLLKALVVYALWYILYNMILSPAGWLDSRMEHYLAVASGWLLSTAGYAVSSQANIIQIHDLAGIEVSRGCDGLAAIGLFISFLVAYPGDMWKRLIMILMGSSFLLIANILRLCALSLSQLYWPGQFDFFHLYLTEAIYDGLVLVLWIFWVHWGRIKRRSEDILNPSSAPG